MAAALTAAAAILVAPRASAAADVVITEVEVPPAPDAKATAKMVRRFLTSSAKRADFGDRSRVRIRARITELELVEIDGVLRVRCTMVGRVEGGHGARSRLDYGGKPSQRTALKKKVVGMVSDGLVTRLAQIAREQK
jgi:hypothetical protein